MTLGNAHAEVGSLEERRRKAALAMQTPEQRARELAREKRRTAEREVERQKEREEGEREAAQKRREEEAQILKVAEEHERKRGEEGRLKKEKRAEEERSLLRRRELGIKPLRTFKSDLAEVSASSQMPSWVAAAPVHFALSTKRAGSKNRYIAEAGIAPGNSWSMWVIGIAVALVSLAAGAAYIYFGSGGGPTTVNDPSAPPAIISSEQTLSFDLTGKGPTEIRELLVREMITKPQKNGLTRSYFLTKATPTSTAEVLTAARWMRQAGLNPPGLLERSLGERFDYGSYVRVPNTSYLVLSTRAPQNAFSGMLQWEDTTLAEDIIPLISGTSIDAALLSDNFEDRVVPGLNIDSRILRDRAGAIRLMWSVLPAQGVIIIAKDETTLTELYRRIIVPAQ